MACRYSSIGSIGANSSSWPQGSLGSRSDRDLSVGEVLLVSDVSISSDEYFKPGGFGRVEELAVSESVPAAPAGFLDDMAD